MVQVYHLCIAENKIPGNHQSHNTALQKVGATVSLKFRRGPIFMEDAYLVFWWESGKTYFSRINPILHGLDAFFFKDGKEMRECKNWNELVSMLPEFNEKGYVTTLFD